VTGIEEVLALWRELERVHDKLPDDDPQRAAVAAEISSVRDLYRRLTEESQQSVTLLKASQRTIERAQLVIRSGAARLPAMDGRPPWSDARSRRADLDGLP
jgi:hypothetical protein